MRKLGIGLFGLFIIVSFQNCSNICQDNQCQGFQSKVDNIEGDIESIAPEELENVNSLTVNLGNCKSEWMAVGGGMSMKVLAFGPKNGLNLRSTKCTKGRRTLKLRNKNKVFASIVVKEQDNRIAVKLSANVKGAYKIGIQFRSSSMQMLNAALEQPGNNKTYFYPYNWVNTKVSGKLKNRAAVGLFTPGIKSSGQYFVVDTNDLQSISSRREGGNYVATMYKTFGQPTKNGDMGRSNFKLKKNEKLSFRVIMSRSLKSIQNTKLGKPRNIPFKKMTQLSYRGWSGKDGDPTDDELKLIAEEVSKGFDAIILRYKNPEDIDPKIFQDHGLKVYVYQFLGSIRTLEQGNLPKGLKASWLQESTANPNCKSRDFNRPTLHNQRPDPKKNRWNVLNLRMKKARQFQVDRIANLVKLGFDGVYFDGPKIGVDSRGRVGGNGRCSKESRESKISWVAGRALLIQELRAKLTKIKPEARIGHLASTEYFDHQHLADYLRRESIFQGKVDEGGNQLKVFKRTISYSRHDDANWAEVQSQFVGTNFFVGTKTPSPLMANTIPHWYARSYQGIHSGIGHPRRKDVPVSAEAIGDLGKYMNALRIKSFSPNSATFRTYGPSKLKSNVTTVIKLNKKRPLLNLKNGKISKSVASHRLSANQYYIIPERSTARGVLWSGYGLIYVSSRSYVQGQFRVSESPPSNRTRVRALIEVNEDKGGGRVTVKVRRKKDLPKLVDENGNAMKGVYRKGSKTYVFNVANGFYEISFLR